MIPIEEFYADPRIVENLNACINCGVCTALCPAADYYDYEPRYVERVVLSHDPVALEELMSSDYIWYCGQCMSCKARCPRENAPGVVISALRYWSQKTGLFAKSKMGRNQVIIKQTIGQNLYDFGYCSYASCSFKVLFLRGVEPSSPDPKAVMVSIAFNPQKKPTLPNNIPSRPISTYSQANHYLQGQY